MSWRRFCVLYRGLSPQSLVCLNYDRIARREGASNDSAEDGAWEMLTRLSKPNNGDVISQRHLL